MDKFVFCSDIHFSDDPPRCYRSMNQKEWYEYQLLIFKEVLQVAKKNKATLVIAGDVFNKPNISLRFLSRLVQLIDKYHNLDIAVCFGQHDLRNHSMVDLEGVPLHFLHRIGKVFFGECFLPHIVFYSWGAHIKESTLTKNICVAHKTIWITPPFPGADPSGNVKTFKGFGYDLMVFGDNHSPFMTKVGNTQILNCGSLIKQSVSETHKPACYLFDEGKLNTIHVSCRDFDEEEYSISETTSIIEDVSNPDGHLSFRRNVETLARSVKPLIAKKAFDIVGRSE